MEGKVLWHVTMSADGFIAGRHDAIDWAFGHGRPGPIADEVIRATGAVLAGRRCYDGGTRPGAHPQGIYGGAWNGPMFVLTHRPPETSPDPQISFLSDGIENVVATALAAAGPKSLGIFGASIARQCIAHGLIDEIVMHVVPVLLGARPGTAVSAHATIIGRSGATVS